MSLQEIQPERVAEVLRDVLAREGLPKAPEESWVAEFFRWLSGSVLGSGRPILTWLFYLTVAGALALLLGSLLPALAGRARARGARTARPPADVQRRRYAELVERARAARARGDLREALRTYLLALVVGLGENGELEFRPAWTNRELLDRGGPPPAVRARLAALFDALEPKTFGHAPVLEGDVAELDSMCDRVLRGEPL